MDNPLTPNKIQRLIHLAEDKSFNLSSRRCLLSEDDLKRLTAHQAALNKTNTNYESSSGILDLEKVEGFGESGIDNMSLSKSTAFNPGEMTGRSTGAEDIKRTVDLGLTRTFEDLGRHSLVLESLTSQMDKQTSEVHDIMRHSIATNYSFHSKRDLTADEASLVMREAPLPIQPNTQTNFAESMTMNNSNLSVGAYFKNRCPDFGRMLGKTDSPERSQRPSITEVSTNAALEYSTMETNGYKMDQSLDSVPVKQPRNTEKATENRIVNNLSTISEKQNNCDVAAGQQDLYKGRLTTKIENPMKLDQKYASTSNINQMTASQKTFMNPTSSKPTDVLLRNLQSSLRMITEDTDCSAENSLSISKIADYLGKQSNVSVTDFLQLGNPKRQVIRKAPLTELSMNMQEHDVNQDIQVASLKDSKKCPTASSAGSVNTVISLDKMRIQEEHKEVPAVVVTQYTSGNDVSHAEDDQKRSTRSKSPSSKSQSTLSTVHENFASFKSRDSSLHSSKGETRTSHVPSPNVEYKELDNSVDWHEVLQQKRLKQEGLAKEEWADIVATPANGFVGVSCPVTITVTTLTDSWLTAKFQFSELPENGKNLTVELPRFPILLSPGKSEQFTLYLTSSVEMRTTLPFTMVLKDAAIDGDIEQMGKIDVNITMPAIQAVSCDGINKLCFPPTPEKTCLTKSFVLMSDCPVDLQLDLSISEGGNMFSIKSVQELKKSDVKKVLMERQGSTEEVPGKGKGKVMSKQLCRLSSGNAIKVVIAFSAPKLSDLNLSETLASFNGILNVNLIGITTILRSIDLVGIVGFVNLAINAPADNKVYLTHESTNVIVTNTGTIPGTWNVLFKHAPGQNKFPFNISPTKFDVRPGGTKTITMCYTGYDDQMFETTLIFEEVSSGIKTTIDIVGGEDKPKIFPIKTNYNSLSWVRAGRKELSLKNSSNKKVHVKCQIVGDGFSIDLPGESRGTFLVPFGPSECRILPIVFAPTTHMPQMATLHLVFDKNSDATRRVKLQGCASGEAPRWAGLVTYGGTALLRAAARAPVPLPLHNRARAPAFVLATVHFNLQWRRAAEGAVLSGARHVVGGRARHVVSLAPQWARVERLARDAPAASALATVTVLTGPEYTRRRILKILRDESNGELDTSLLPEHLQGLAGKFEGEDTTMDEHIADFKETKASLNELISGLQELSAQIDLPQDFADENTIIITDDTVVEHHTLCD